MSDVICVRIKGETKKIIEELQKRSGFGKGHLIDLALYSMYVNLCFDENDSEVEGEDE